MEDGLMKQVTEQYSIDALSYAEAENRMIDKMRKYISNDFEVADIKKAAYKEVFFDENDNCSDRYYRAKLAFITVDEKQRKRNLRQSPTAYRRTHSSTPSTISRR